MSTTTIALAILAAVIVWNILDMLRMARTIRTLHDRLDVLLRAQIRSLNAEFDCACDRCLDAHNAARRGAQRQDPTG